MWKNVNQKKKRYDEIQPIAKIDFCSSSYYYFFPSLFTSSTIHFRLFFSLDSLDLFPFHFSLKLGSSSADSICIR